MYLPVGDFDIDINHFWTKGFLLSVAFTISLFNVNLVQMMVFPRSSSLVAKTMLTIRLPIASD